MAVGNTGVAEIVVEVAFVPRPPEAPKVAPELVEPAIYKELSVGFDCLDLADFFERNDNSSNDCSIARNSVMLEGPTIAQELGAQVPLFGPIRFQTLSSFLVPDSRPSVPLSKHIEATNVDKGIAGRVEGEPWKVEGDCEREFK